jgi:hypothetical protein
MGSILAAVGGLLVLIGAIWIAVIAFQSGDIVWGVLSLICGIVAIIYGAQHMDKARTPLFMLIGGIVINLLAGAFGGFSVNTP